jgi:hypothetical protein
MTTKLTFLTSACAVFNCTPSVVLQAVAKKTSVHPDIAIQIRAMAEKSCNATPADWELFAAEIQDSEVASKLLWSLVTGAEYNVSPLPAVNAEN